MTANALESINALFTEKEEFASSMPLFLSSIRERLSPHYPSAKILNSFAGQCKNGELVRFRGIIQNSQGFELIASHLMVTKENGEQQSICGAFQNDFEANWSSHAIESKTTASRYLYSACEIPGETEWMLSKFLLQGNNEKEEMRQKVEQKKFIIKFYEECDDSLLPNTIVDVYGIYQDGVVEASKEIDPTASFPSIHVIQHCVIDPTIIAPRPTSYDPDTKSQLAAFLSSLLGCEVAGHYMLSSLVSKTYAWRDDCATLCSLPLNIANVKNSQDIIGALKMLMPMVQVIEVTREVLETEKLFPVMDHETEFLSFSRLQLCRGSVLILDMTKFEIGNETINLKNNAVENIQALKTLIAEQKILYDYKYYKHPLETDVITIVLSKEPWKIVETPFVIALPSAFIDGVDPINELKRASPNTLDSFRHFLADARTRVQSVEIPRDFQRTVCEGFTEIRREYNEKAPEKLKQLLTLTRLMAVIDNKTEMDMDCYKKVTELEKRRSELVNDFLNTL